VAYGVPVLVVAAGWLVRRELARRGAVSVEPIVVTADAAVAAGTAVTEDAAVMAEAAVTAASAVPGPGGSGADRLTAAGTRVDGVPV
jgi:hypothetical protein